MPKQASGKNPRDVEQTHRMIGNMSMTKTTLAKGSLESPREWPLAIQN